MEIFQDSISVKTKTLMCKMPCTNIPASWRQSPADRRVVLVEVTDIAKPEKNMFFLLFQSEEKSSQNKYCLVMVLRGGGSRKFEIKKNLQWPRSFSYIYMESIWNHLHGCGENF